MGKIKNHARVYHGRHKGETDTHVPNEKVRTNWEEVQWNSKQLCERCWRKPCECEEDEENIFGSPV